MIGFRLGPTHKRKINRTPTEALSYIDRVETDGGTVSNLDWVGDHFGKLKDLRWLSQLVCLHDPASGVKTSGGNITKIYDYSPNNFDITQGTSSNQPSLNSGGWGQLDAGSFDGTDDILSHPDADLLNLYENTGWFILWYKVNNNGLNTNQAFGKWDATNNEKEFAMRVRDSVHEVDFNISTNGDLEDDAGVVYPSANEWIMFYGGYDDTSNSETVYASVNNGTIDSDPVANSPNRFTAPYEYGGITDLGEFFEGDLGLLLYGKRPNPQDPLPHEDGTLTNYYNFTKKRAGV